MVECPHQLNTPLPDSNKTIYVQVTHGFIQPWFQFKNISNGVAHLYSVLWLLSQRINTILFIQTFSDDHQKYLNWEVMRDWPMGGSSSTTSGSGSGSNSIDSSTLFMCGNLCISIIAFFMYPTAPGNHGLNNSYDWWLWRQRRCQGDDNNNDDNDAPTISLGSHQNIGLHNGARANVVLLTYLLITMI